MGVKIAPHLGLYMELARGGEEIVGDGLGDTDGMPGRLCDLTSCERDAGDEQDHGENDVLRGA
jgi:hypothetical protein